MEELIKFPFCHIDSDNEFLSAIWNERDDASSIPSCNYNTNPNDKLVFNAFENIDDITPTNWNPYACQYTTLDEIGSSLILCKNITIAQLNIRSLKKNFEQFKTFFNTFKTLPHVVALAETWMKEHDEELYNISGYSFVSLPRKSRIGGGVGIYVQKSLTFNIRSDLMIDCADVCEYIVLEIPIDKNNCIILLSIYRPPNTDLVKFNEKFNNLLEKINKESNKKVFIASDLNIDLLKSEHHHNTEEFLNILLSNGFLPSISRPTRITENSCTLLNNIFMNCFEYLNYSSIVYDDISDHLPIVINVNFNQPTINNTQSNNKREYKKENYNTFYNKLKSINWKNFSVYCTPGLDSSAAFNEFYTHFYQLYNESFPLIIAFHNCVSNNSNKNQPWLTQAFIKSYRKKIKTAKKL